MTDGKITSAEIDQRARLFYGLIDQAMDEIMKRVGGIHDQPRAEEIIDIFAKCRIQLEQREGA